MQQDLSPGESARSREGFNQKKEPELILQQTSVERFQGPLPPPEILEKYDKIVPGAAERIIKLAEEQSKHRRRIEEKVIGADTSKSVLGVLFAFIIALLGLIIGGYTALKGQPLFGGAVSITIIASMVGAFIYGTQQRKRSKE